jgi:hypothetical protein
MKEPPKSAQEAVRQLLSELSDTDKLAIKNTSEEEPDRFHLALGNYYLGLNLGNILIIACKDQGYFRKCPWDWVLPNKMQSQVGKLSRNRTLPLLWPE